MFLFPHIKCNLGELFNHQIVWWYCSNHHKRKLATPQTFILTIVKKSYQLCNAQVPLCITHTNACTPHIPTLRWNISFICTVLCKLVGEQTCATCYVMLSSRRILSPLSQAWGKSKASLSFMFYYHSSASLLIQAASAGQCIRISEHWPGKDFYFQVDRIMFYWVADNW